MWFWNVFNQGCCCAADESEKQQYYPFERPVAYSPQCEPGPDPMGPAKAIVHLPKLKRLSAHYHLTDVGTGVKTRQFDLTSRFVSRYYAALNAVAVKGWGQFMSLWADDTSGIYMEGFAGAAAMRTRADILAFVETFPDMSVEMTSMKVDQDELQAASSCIFHLQNPPAGVPSKINCVKTCKLNSYGKLVSLRMYWHPSEIGGAAKSSQYEITAQRIRTFLDALNKTPTDLAPWTSQSDGIQFEDPVGTLPRNIDKVVEAYVYGLPPFIATLRMVRVGQDELQAAAVIDFIFPDNNLLVPFAIIFIFRFE